MHTINKPRIRHNSKTGRHCTIEALEGRRLLTILSFVRHTVPESESGIYPFVVEDFDSDGDPDFLNGSGFFQNVDGRGTYEYEPNWLVQGPPEIVAVGDIDADGDIDLIQEPNDPTPKPNAGPKRDRLLVHENLGTGRFADGVPIKRAHLDSRVFSLALADIDRDGDLDLISSAIGSGRPPSLVWYENQDSKGSFVLGGSKQTQHHGELLVGDVDGDLDNDVLIASIDGLADGLTLEWYENVGGKEPFGHPLEIGGGQYCALRSHRVSIVDVDGDNDLDLFVTCPSEVSWYENLDGKGSFAASQILSLPQASEEFKGSAIADFDLDGDNDVIVFNARNRDIQNRRLSDDTVLWWIERQGSEFTHPVPILATLPSMEGGDRTPEVVDVDGDGDLDLLAWSPQALDDLGRRYDLVVTWYENRLTGDVDDNGEVTLADFMALSTTYGRAADAIWEDGDFNGDGRVDFTDFILLSTNYGSKRLERG